MRIANIALVLAAAFLSLPVAQAAIVDNPDSIMNYWGKSSVFPAGPTWSFDTIGQSKLVFEPTPIPEGVNLVGNPGSVMDHYGKSSVFRAGPTWSFKTIGRSKFEFR